MPEINFADAPDVERIAHKLITEHHKHLADARIKYLGREGAWSVGGKIRWGSAEKCSAKHRHLTGYDFIIVVNIDVWEELDEKQQLALVDHELSHCGIGDNGLCIWSHDVEDFASVVRRHGLWQEGVRKYAEAAVEASRQLTIFDTLEKKVS